MLCKAVIYFPMVSVVRSTGLTRGLKNSPPDCFLLPSSDVLFKSHCIEKSSNRSCDCWIFGARDGTRLCCANPALSATVAYATVPAESFGAENSSSNCFLNAPHPLRLQVPNQKREPSNDDSHFWCERRDLNPYVLLHTPLKRARLPIPPLSLIRFRPSRNVCYYIKALPFCQHFFVYFF